MASSTAGTGGEWLVIMPDKPGVLNKRIEVREYVYLSLAVHFLFRFAS